MSNKVIKSSKTRAKNPAHKKVTTEWSVEIARKAIQLEEQYYAKHNNNHELIIKFPDPELSEEIVKNFSSSIQHVQFQYPVTPRECIIKLNENSNVDKTIKEISKIRFGGGKLQVVKNLAEEPKLNVSPEEIDPFTIYFGNLPHSKISSLKVILKNGEIQIGHNKRKPKAYLFATFKSFEDAVRGFKKCAKKFPPSQFITIRFKRNKTKQIDDSSSQDNSMPSFPIEQIPTVSSPPIEDNGTPQRNQKYYNRGENFQDNQSESPASEEVVKIPENSQTDLNEFDPNLKIKEEPGINSKYLGFKRIPYIEDMDGDTDCSNSTRSNSVDSNGARKRASSDDDSIWAITDSDDEEDLQKPKMKKPKLLVLPMELHGSLREVKDEDNDTTDDEIGDIGDLDFI